MNERLIAQRKKKELTQKQAAKGAGVSERMYQRYEAGTAVPSVPVAIKLAATLECRIEDIF